MHDRAQERLDRIAERTQVDPRQLVPYALENLDIGFESFSREDAFERRLEPMPSLAAGRALTARFVREETDESVGGLDKIRRLVEHDHRARAEHRPRLGERLVVVREIQVLLEKAGGRSASRLNGDAFTSVAHPPGDLDQLADRRPERDFIVAGLVDVAADRDDLITRRTLRPDGLEPVGAVLEDVWKIGEGLDVVDDGRFLIKAFDRRERRLETRFAAPALERIQQRRLLAADVRPRTAVDRYLKAVARTEDVVPDIAGRPRLRERGAKDLIPAFELAADVDERVVAADRVRAECDPFDDLMGRLFEEHVVLERPRLGFVTIADEIARLVVLGKELPFPSGREACPAAAAQQRRIGHLPDLFGRKLTQRTLELRVAALRLVDFDVAQIELADSLRQDGRNGHYRDGAPSPTTRSPWGARPARTFNPVVVSARHHPPGGRITDIACLPSLLLFVRVGRKPSRGVFDEPLTGTAFQPPFLREALEHDHAAAIADPARIVRIQDALSAGRLPTNVLGNLPGPLRLARLGERLHRIRPRAHGRQHLVDELRREVVDEFEVHLHAGGAMARRQAFDLFIREESVVGRLEVPDPKLLAEIGHDLLGVLDHARETAADLQHVFADRLAEKQRVKRDDRLDDRRREAEHLRSRPHRLTRDETFFFLKAVHHGEERRARFLILGDDRFELGTQPLEQRRKIDRRRRRRVRKPLLRAHRAHRSTSPKTGSREPMITTMSAMSSPIVSVLSSWV